MRRGSFLGELYREGRGVSGESGSTDARAWIGVEIEFPSVAGFSSKIAGNVKSCGVVSR